MTQQDFAGLVYATVLGIRMHPGNDINGEPDVTRAVEWARRMALLASQEWPRMGKSITKLEEKLQCQSEPLDS